MKHTTAKNYLKYALSKGWLRPEDHEDVAFPIPADKLMEYVTSLRVRAERKEIKYSTVTTMFNELSHHHRDMGVDWSATMLNPQVVAFRKHLAKMRHYELVTRPSPPSSAKLGANPNGLVAQNSPTSTSTATIIKLPFPDSSIASRPAHLETPSESLDSHVGPGDRYNELAHTLEPDEIIAADASVEAGGPSSIQTSVASEPKSLEAGQPVAKRAKLVHLPDEAVINDNNKAAPQATIESSEFRTESPVLLNTASESDSFTLATTNAARAIALSKMSASPGSKIDAPPFRRIMLTGEQSTGCDGGNSFLKYTVLEAKWIDDYKDWPKLFPVSLERFHQYLEYMASEKNMSVRSENSFYTYINDLKKLHYRLEHENWERDVLNDEGTVMLLKLARKAIRKRELAGPIRRKKDGANFTNIDRANIAKGKRKGRGKSVDKSVPEKAVRVSGRVTKGRNSRAWSASSISFEDELDADHQGGLVSDDGEVIAEEEPEEAAAGEEEAVEEENEAVYTSRGRRTSSRRASSKSKTNDDGTATSARKIRKNAASGKQARAKVAQDEYMELEYQARPSTSSFMSRKISDASPSSISRIRDYSRLHPAAASSVQHQEMLVSAELRVRELENQLRLKLLENEKFAMRVDFVKGLIERGVKSGSEICELLPILE